VKGRHRAAVRELCKAGKTLAAHGLTPGTSGNISVRVEHGYAMSPTNASLGDLEPENVALLDESGAHVGGPDPTKERALHLAFYERQPDVRAIVHVHSTYAVALSCLVHDDPEDVLRPLTPYAIVRIGRLALAPYARPGSPGLVAAVTSRAAGHRALLLANHGPIFAAETLAQAVAGIEEIEEAAKLQLLLDGRPTRVLSPEEIADLRS
jgi:ribulose-5-phosphate 4-epimerase/fuculose-1-phosphate aldolase